MSVSVILPTCGRPSLSAAIASVLPELARDDELLVCADGEQRYARGLCTLAREMSAGRVSYVAARSSSVTGSCFGNSQRDEGIQAARGSHLAFLDDDDVWQEGAGDLIREASETEPDAAHVFRAEWGARHPAAGTVLWHAPMFTAGNVGTPMLVLPRTRRLPAWMTSNEDGVLSDFGWLSAAVAGKPLRWHEETICTVRPEAR